MVAWPPITHDILRNRQMIEAYLPLSGSSTVFEDMACDDYKDETEDTLARACGIVVEMGRKGVKPNNGTYRYMVCCGMSWCDMVWHGMACIWYVYGMVWYGMV